MPEDNAQSSDCLMGLCLVARLDIILLISAAQGIWGISLWAMMASQVLYLLHPPYRVTIPAIEPEARKRLHQAVVHRLSEQLKHGRRPDEGGEELQVCVQSKFFYLQICMTYIRGDRAIQQVQKRQKPSIKSVALKIRFLLSVGTNMSISLFIPTLCGRSSTRSL